MQESGRHLEFFRRESPEVRFVWTPSGVDTTRFRDYGLPKVYDVLLYGVLEPDIYPFRTRLFKLLPTISGLRVRQIEHPGYYSTGESTANEAVTGVQLAQILNQSWT